MKSKKWLISLGLAVVLVVSFALPGCGGGGEPTPGGRVSFSIGTTGFYLDVATMIVEDLQDFGLDVDLQTLDSTTFYDYLYYPQDGGMEACVCAEDPSPDPWNDWIWMMLCNPETYGSEWNPCWYYNPEYDVLYEENYFAETLEEKQEILYGMQEILAEDIPMVFLVREDLIAACRSDRWDNWYNMMGGYATWINEYSIREVTNKTADTRLNIGVANLPGNLYMNQEELQATNVGCLYLMLVYENLAGYPKLEDPGVTAYDFVPKLATDYTVSYEPDGTGGTNQVWTVNLRDDVKWHDGEDFTADDVVFSLKHIISPWGRNRPVNWTAVDARGGEDILPEDILVTKTGDYQVQFRYIEGDHQNEDYFPCCFMWYAIVPQHKFEGQDPFEYDGEYIGTGPYKVKEFVPDDYLLLERNDDYWGADDSYWGLPAAKEVLFKLYENTGQFWVAFEAGQMDSSASFSVPFQKKDDYEADPNITVDVVPDLSIYWLAFNLHPTAGYEPLQDLALRQAIAAAIDKEGIVDMVFGGYAEPADSWVYLESPNHYGGPNNYGVLPNNEYDLDKAAQILEDAGYTKDDDGYWCLPAE